MKNYVLKSFFWGAIAKVIDAAVKFITLPILLLHFGKEQFALVALATSVNAYMQLLDMGINTGAVKYYSEWIGESKYSLLNTVARTSILFYLIIGLINALALIILAKYGIKIFNINIQQADELKQMFYILAFFSVLNWSTSVFNQLIIASENIIYIQKISIIRSILIILMMAIIIEYNYNVIYYFLTFTFLNSLSIIPLYKKAKSENLIISYLPDNDWENFKVVLKYSSAIVAISVFQMSATQLRPIILGIFTDKGIGVITEYRVMETITVFIISIGGMFVPIFMPKVSKLLREEKWDKIQDFAYNSTLFTSIICCFLCFPFIICSKEILSIYVGDKYEYLSYWLIVWVVTILLYLHNSPVSSLVLATGKTKMLVYSSAISCLISLFINSLLVKYLGVGSAIFGYFIYILIQMSFYYFYFNNKVLNLKSVKILTSFLTPTATAGFAAICILLLDIRLESVLSQLMIKVTLWLIAYIFFLLIFNVISEKEKNNVIIYLNVKAKMKKL